MVDLGRQVCDERLDCPALLRSTQIFEGMWQLDLMLKEPTLGLGYWSIAHSHASTDWHSLSTRSPKHSSPAISGTPVSSAGHLGVDGIDMVGSYDSLRLPSATSSSLRNIERFATR